MSRVKLNCEIDPGQLNWKLIHCANHECYKPGTLETKLLISLWYKVMCAHTCAPMHCLRALEWLYNFYAILPGSIETWPWRLRIEEVHDTQWSQRAIPNRKSVRGTITIWHRSIETHSLLSTRCFCCQVLSTVPLNRLLDVPRISHLKRQQTHCVKWFHEK